MPNPFDQIFSPPVGSPLALLALVALTGCSNREARLSETGLYDDITTKSLRPDLEFYAPQFPLWSDGVEKKRYIRLPEGTRIDTSDMDAWVFPIGTELYKEFSENGRRLETRLQRKEADGSWTMAAYVWNDDESDADLAPLGAENISGGDHDSPPDWDCTYCHGADTKPLGFSAIQLSHAGDGMTLRDLVDQDLLTNAPEAPIVIPGDALDHQVLGALHVNCGGCHSDTGELRRLGLRLALKTTQLRTVDDTPAAQTAVNVAREEPMAGLSTYIVPGRPEQSLLHFRMAQRGADIQMPPIGSERPDVETLRAFDTWIRRLDDTLQTGANQ